MKFIDRLKEITTIEEIWSEEVEQYRFYFYTFCKKEYFICVGVHPELDRPRFMFVKLHKKTNGGLESIYLYQGFDEDKCINTVWEEIEW